MIVVLNFSLFIGVKTIVMSKFDLEKYLETIQTHKITYAHVVPPIVVALAKHPSVDKYNLSSLKMIFSGAAPLGVDIERAVIQRLKVPVKQAYGMTELSPACHINPTKKIISGSVGVLVPNCVAKITDVESGAPLSIGQDGEICVKGPNVMKGYLNNSSATAAMIDSEGFVHTGDIGHIDSEGYYYVVDRVKELIKYKGFQVAPAELEAILLTHPAIADVAVIPKPDEEAGELPKAFIVLKKEQQLSESQVQEWLDDKIAPHKKLRGGVEFISEIPKSASGKILRRILVQKERAKLEQKKG